MAVDMRAGLGNPGTTFVGRIIPDDCWVQTAIRSYSKIGPKGRSQMSLFEDNMIMYIENPIDSTKKKQTI